MVESINALNYFENTSSTLSKDYDFNNDGTVDIADYNLACLYLSDDDASNDVKFTQEELDNAFAAMIEKEKNNQSYDKITEENAVEIADALIDAVKSDACTPAKAKKLNQLQQMGKDLAKYMQECTEVAKILEKKIEKQKKELDEVTAEKQAKEEAYAAKAEEVNKKSTELEECVVEILRKSHNMSETYIEKSNQIVQSCIDDYAHGKCAGQSLQEYIATKLAQVGGFGISKLEYEIANETSLGSQIKSLCSDLTGLSADIKDVSARFITINARYNHSVTSRAGVLDAAQIASDKYKTGYDKRIELRNEIINNYKVEGNGEFNTSNEQVKSLAQFLDNKELNDMPYSDAWVVLQGAFGNCGLIFDESKKEISIPNGTDEVGANIYNALATSIEQNYGIKPTRYDKETPPTTTPEPTADPDYEGKVYIVTAYNNTWFSKGKKAQLTLGDNILDFSAKTKKRGAHFCGSKDHNRDKTNDNEWTELYNKLPDDVKNLPLTEGQAYILTEDGEILGTAASTQIADVNYGKKTKMLASDNLVNNDFQVTSDLGITNKGKNSGEEGSGGTITLNGKTYQVAQTIYRKSTPLVLDLKGDGLKNTDVSSGVNFDLNADGITDRTAWTAAQTEFDNAFLVLDKNGDGQINDGSELFGDQNGADNGFAELSKYDSNGDGKIDAKDDAYSQMQLWCDMNADGKVDEGEMKHLDEMGVKELDVNHEEILDDNGNLIEDEFGNTTGLQGGFTRADGTKGTMTDVLFNNMSLDSGTASNFQTEAAKKFAESNLFAKEDEIPLVIDKGADYSEIKATSSNLKFLDTDAYTFNVDMKQKTAANIFKSTMNKINSNDKEAENYFLKKSEALDEEEKEKEKEVA